MRLRIHAFLAVLLVVLTARVQHSRHSSGWLRETSIARVMGRSVLRATLQDRIPRIGDTRYSHLHGGSSDKTAHDEKRHRNSLIPQAIVADFAPPRPQFTYCSRNYSLFLPDGCVQRPFHDSSLRGPPSCC